MAASKTTDIAKALAEARNKALEDAAKASETKTSSGQL